MKLEGEHDSLKVLIIGAGPCGLMAAILLARYGIEFIIIDKLPARNRAGRSESIQPRTLEVLESLHLRERVERQGQKLYEYALYTRDAQDLLKRAKVANDVTVPAHYPYTVTIDKGKLEKILEDELNRLGHRVRMSAELAALSRTNAPNVWHAAVVDHISGTAKLTSPSFILGCDGADSVVRNHLGIRSSCFSRSTWAVADVSVRTNFEDIRRRCTVQSSHGNCIITPRRNGIRMRTLLTEADLASDEWDQTSTFFAGIESALQARIAAAISPKTLELTRVSWVKKFNNDKQLADSFVDKDLAIYLLGNAACVTSPLTRQGINGGMMDAWNLAWKLALFLKDIADLSILSTYNVERRGLFIKAIEFDLKAEEMFALRDASNSEATAIYDCEEASGYTSGTGCRYPPSRLVQAERRTFLSKGFEVLTPGKRLFPSILTRHVDGNAVNVLELLEANCRFKLFMFFGQMLKTGQAMVSGLAGYLGANKSSLLGLTTTKDGISEQLVDLFIVHTLPHLQVSVHEFPQPLPEYADNIFEDVVGRWHSEVGIYVKAGGYCLVRPDGYVAIVSNLDDCDRVRQYIATLR